MKANSFDILCSYLLHLAFTGHVQVTRMLNLLINLISKRSEKIASKHNKVKLMAFKRMILDQTSLSIDVIVIY